MASSNLHNRLYPFLFPFPLQPVGVAGPFPGVNNVILFGLNAFLVCLLLEGVLGEVASCAGRPEKAVAPSRVKLLLNVLLLLSLLEQLKTSSRSQGWGFVLLVCSFYTLLHCLSCAETVMHTSAGWGGG